MSKTRLPPIENFDDIMSGIEIIERDKFFSLGNQIVNKAVVFDVHKQFKASQEKLFINEEGKSYFVVKMSRGSDIVSHIDIGCSTVSSKLKVSSSLIGSNRRVVNCASIYTPINLIITLDESHNLEEPIYLSWKKTVLMDNIVRNRVMNANLLCDGIHYLNGMVLI